MTRGWHGDPGRHALARKGMRTSIPRRPHRAVQKSLILSPTESHALKAVEQEAHILKRQIEERNKMLARLELVAREARASGDKEAARRAELLQEEMLRDIEMRVDKLQKDVNMLEREHPTDSNVRYLSKVSVDVAIGLNALEMKYSS